MFKKIQIIFLGLVAAVLLAGCPVSARAQMDEVERFELELDVLQSAIGSTRNVLVDKAISFDTARLNIPEEVEVKEILWDFGDGILTTGDKVSHAYSAPGTYLVRLTIRTSDGQNEDTAEVRVFDQVITLLTDASASDEELELAQQQAADEGLLLFILKSKSGGPEALIEEDLTQQLASARDEVIQSDLVVAWTSGGVGANVLSKFAQLNKQGDEALFDDLSIGGKGVIILSNTPFAVLTPVAQSAFDQLQPAYVLLTKPEALPLLYDDQTVDEAKNKILASPIEYRLLGTFSERAISDLGITNFMSFGINYLVNNGVPINNIMLILSIPVIATILSFTRQVIGIKAFGLITPAMTALSFLVLGLSAGIIVFIVVLLSGTLTRILLRKLHMLYLPRMALVLTSASLAILVMLGLGVFAGRTATLSFSIFPILILTILAEEFIAVQFTRGARAALTITAWTLALAVLCYYIVSWQLFRTLLLSYPETVLLAIPANILLGRFSGLRLIEYFRFRELLRHGNSAE